MSCYTDNEPMMQEDIICLIEDECDSEFEAEMVAYVKKLFAIKQAAINARNALAARHTSTSLWAAALLDVVWEAEKFLDEVLPIKDEE